MGKWFECCEHSSVIHSWWFLWRALLFTFPFLDPVTVAAALVYTIMIRTLQPLGNIFGQQELRLFDSEKEFLDCRSAQLLCLKTNLELDSLAPLLVLYPFFCCCVSGTGE